MSCVFATKKAAQLRVGDIFDVSDICQGFGWRYHVVKTHPKQCGAHPENVHFDCEALNWRQFDKRNRDYGGWPLHIAADADVRVLRVLNERLPDELDEPPSTQKQNDVETKGD